MRITRLYLPVELSCDDKIELDKNSSNHLIRVLRTKINSPLILFNGDGFDYHAITLDDHAKRTSVLIESRNKISNESNLSVTLVQGLSRQDRMETSVQKSVELGANKIIPLLCQRSNLRLSPEKASKKLGQWRSIAISASEQSGRCVIPEVTEILTIDNIEQYISEDSVKIILEPNSDNTLKELAPVDNSFVVCIGPEGGFNDIELALLKDKGFKAVRFGPRILRTETAGPAVLSALQVLWGDI